MKLFEKFIRNESGAIAIEYTFVAGIISIAIVSPVFMIGAKISVIFANVQTGF